MCAFKPGSSLHHRRRPPPRLVGEVHVSHRAGSWPRINSFFFSRHTWIKAFLTQEDEGFGGWRGGVTKKTIYPALSGIIRTIIPPTIKADWATSEASLSVFSTLWRPCCRGAKLRVNSKTNGLKGMCFQNSLKHKRFQHRVKMVYGVNLHHRPYRAGSRTRWQPPRRPALAPPPAPRCRGAG